MSAAPLEAFDTPRRLVAEALGTALLLAVVVGSGIMGERLAGGNDAIALLGNTLATGAGLVVLISIFGPLSGAHFNPAVTFAFLVRREISWRRALGYVAVQVAGAVTGVFAAHAMFAEPILQISTKLRDGPAQAFSEFVATFDVMSFPTLLFFVDGRLVQRLVGARGLAALREEVARLQPVAATVPTPD